MSLRKLKILKIVCQLMNLAVLCFLVLLKGYMVS